MSHTDPCRLAMLSWQRELGFGHHVRQLHRLRSLHWSGVVRCRVCWDRCFVSFVSGQSGLAIDAVLTSTDLSGTTPVRIRSRSQRILELILTSCQCTLPLGLLHSNRECARYGCREQRAPMVRRCHERILCVPFLILGPRTSHSCSVYRRTTGLISRSVQIHLSASNVTTKYYGIPDVRTRNTNESLLATFTVQPGSNKLNRPVAGGQVSGGVLKSQATGGA